MHGTRVCRVRCLDGRAPETGWGLVIVVIGVHAAAEVWEVASEEHLAAKALASEPLD